MSNIRRHNYLIPKIKEQFPELTEDQIDMIIREGCYQLQNRIYKGLDVVLKNSFKKLSMTFYHYVYKKGGYKKKDGNP